MTLGELTCPNRGVADSLYALIRNGVAFDTLLKDALGVTSNEKNELCEAVDIALYPRHIRNVLETLRPDDTTQPIRVGNRYVIYKRFKDDKPRVQQ